MGGVFGVCLLAVACGGTVTGTAPHETGGTAGRSEVGGASSSVGSGGAVPSTIGRLPDGGCPAPSVGIGSNCIAPVDATLLCESRVAGGNAGDRSCGFGCLCSFCAAETLECYAGSEPYCGTIIDCAQARRCVQVACYQESTCQRVIDGAPNGGLSAESVGLASAVMDCMAKLGRYAGRLGAVCPITCP